MGEIALTPGNLGLNISRDVHDDTCDETYVWLRHCRIRCHSFLEKIDNNFYGLKLYRRGFIIYAKHSQLRRAL